jgi:fibronectin type 3 domain-containing protein
MKKTIILVLTVLTLALISCDTGNGNNGNGTSDPDGNGRTYAKELWGEWLRMDTGDKWYISDNAVKVNGAASSTTATLTKQSERVVEVTDEGRKYYLYASRIANASFTGTIVGDTGTDSVRAVGASRRRVTVANRGNKSNISSVVTGEQGSFIAEGIIPGDTYEVTPEGGTPVTVKPDNDGSDVGVITVTSGVNFKTAIIPTQSTTDVTEMYINESHAFSLEFENTGTEDCPAPSYTIDAPEGVTITGNLQGVLGTIEPGVKKSVPINVTCSAVTGDHEYKKIRITIRDGAGKTWEDSVSLRFYKETMDFNIRAERPISGIVISPDSKIYSFINVTNGTLTAPRRVGGDYLVVFSGATLETETRYSLGIGVGADTDFASFIETGKYEPNNTEETTASVGEQKIMEYLYKNDIDYYRVSYGDLNVPSAPTNVSARVADAEITLSWDAVEGAVSYNVYRSTSQTGTYAKIGEGASPSYTDTVTDIGTYWYRVSAVSARNFASSYSAPTSATTEIPSAPTNVSARVADAKVTLSWDAVEGAVSYNVYRSTSPTSQTGTYTKIIGGASPSYTDTVTTTGTYWYRVRAVSAGNFVSSYSASTSATVAGPSAPTNVSISAADAEVTVSWDAVGGAVSYNVYRSTSQTGTYTKVGDGASSSYTDTVAAVGTYWYEVSAVSAGGVEGLHSTQISVMTDFTIEINVSNLSDTLSWLSTNALSENHYILILGKDETISAQTLSYSGKTNITISVEGGTAERLIALSSSGSLFTVGNGVTLTLGNNVSLQGLSNTASLVKVNSGGTLVMESGSKISGNRASSYPSSYGGGVYISGMFTMNGGEISGNTANYGGGVYVYSSGTFTMNGGEISGNTTSHYFGSSDFVGGIGGGVFVSGGTFIKQSGGTIYGSDASDSLKNTATIGDIYGYIYGHAVYATTGKIRNDTAGMGVTLDSSVSGSAGGWE